MVRWRIEENRLEIMFQNRDDIKNFIRNVIANPAQMLGLEVTIKDNPLEIIIREKTSIEPTRSFILKTMRL
jgi:ABC-type tungstate transport system permease subunit